MEQEKMSSHNNRDIKSYSVQQGANIEDILLEMIQHEAQLKMKIAHLQQEIEISLETGEKDRFLHATSELKEFEMIMNQ